MENESQVKTRGNSLCRLQTAHHVNEAMPDHQAAWAIHRVMEGNINGCCFKPLCFGVVYYKTMAGCVVTLLLS